MKEIFAHVLEICLLMLKCKITVKFEILFGILESYLFLHIREYIIKIGKISNKIHEIVKIKAIFFIGNDAQYKAVKMAK